MPARKSKHSPPTRHRNSELVPEGQRPCPICGTAMKTERRGADSIDVCVEHGVWLDKDELERMFERRTRRFERRIEDARRQARADGLFWGTLLF